MARIAVQSHLLFGTDGSSLWLGAIDVNRIYPVDLQANALGTPFAARAPVTPAVGVGSVWSATGGLIRYDPATGKVIGESQFFGSGGLAVGYGAVWRGATDKLLRIEP